MKTMIIIFILLFCGAIFAQTAPEVQKESFALKGYAPLFDPSKLSMRHSYSISYYSGGGNSGSIGYYLNSIEYAFSNPLKIRVDIGYYHSPMSLISKNASNTGSGLFVPSVSLNWKPTDNFRFSVDFRQAPVYDRTGGYYQNNYFWEESR